MQRITGLPDEQVLAYEAQAEAAMRAALEHVMDVIARRIEASMPVLASVLVAADQGDEIPPSDVPVGDGLPPGQPYVSPDDLASIPPLWQEAVTQQILPIVAQVFMDAAGRTHANMVDASSITSLPSVGSLAAEQYLARAQNTFEQVGDDLWATARTELSDGFERGESIPQLAERLRASAGVTARTGVLVARTQVNEASNAGSFATAQASGLKMQKEFIATPDLRTRPTHLAADGQRVDLNEPFIVGGYSAMFPAAPTLPPAERYNCRCTIGYLMPDRAPAQVRKDDLQDQQLADLPGTSGMAAEIEAPLAALALGVRSVIAEARTLREVDAAAMTEARRLTGRDIRFDQRGSDVQVAREHAEGILRGLERYPESPISQVGTFGPGSSAELITRARGVPDFDEPKAFTATLPGNDVVLFNVRLASDPEAYQAALLRGHGAGWHANGTATPMGQALHEFGHTVDETFTEAGAKVGAVRSQMTVPFTGKAYKEAVRTEVSGYAATSTHELGGEAFADVMINGERASATSRAVFDAIERGYAKVHPRVGETFPKAAGPDFDIPARGPTAPPSYVRPSLKAAKTPRELRRVWQDEAQAATGFPFFVQAMPRGISMVTAREYAEGTLQMLERFPGARVDQIKWFDDAASKSYAQVRRGGHAIEFNMKYASEGGRPRFLESRRRDAAGWDVGDTSWGVRNDTTGQGVVYHEFMHILDLENTREKIHGSLVPLLIREADREGVTDIEDLIRRRVSSYAASSKGNMQELIAEAGADVMVNGAQASQLSRSIFDLLQAEYRARGFGLRVAPVDELGEAFPKLVAPKALGSQTVAQLRALAKERGIVVPAATRKADLVKMLEESPSPAVAPVMTTKGEVESLDRLARRASSAKVERLGRDTDAIVDRLTFPDQSSIVRKSYHRPEKLDSATAAFRTDAEELGALVARTIEIRAPLTTRVGLSAARRRDTIFMEDMKGVSGREAGLDAVTSNDRRKVGLLDLLIGQSDRNTDNWRIDKSGHIIVLDHGRAFLSAYNRRTRRGVPSEDSWFTRPFTQHRSGDKEGFEIADSIDVAPEDLETIRRRLESLASEFDRLGRSDWHKQMMDDLAALERAATPGASPLGLLAEVAPSSTPAALGEAAVARQAAIDAARPVADLAVRMDEIVANGASRKALLHTVDTSGLPATELTRLRALVDDPAALRAATRDLATRAGADLTGATSDVVRFDRTLHEPIGTITPGAPVEIVRPGVTVRVGNEVVPVRKATVQATDRALTPAPVAPPAPLPTTLPGLRALAKQRGITVPTGTRKADLVRMLETRAEEGPASRAAQRAEVRARAAAITAQRGNAALLARVDELVQAKASKAVIRQELDPALRQAEQLYAGADEGVANALRDALDSGEPAKLRAAITRQSKASGLTPIGKAGAKAKFDPATMEGVGGTAIPDGADVIVVRRGTTIAGLETPERATVRLAKPAAPPFKFEAAKAKTFAPVREPRTATVIHEPPDKITEIVTPWGETQRFKGTWVKVQEPGEPGKFYGSAYAEWQDMYEAVPGEADKWIKTAKVQAYQHRGAPRVITTTLADGTVETTNTAKAGDWIVRQTNGEIQVLTPEKFARLYTQPMTPAQFNAKIKAAAKKQEALDAAPFSTTDRAYGPNYVPDAVDRYRLGPDVNDILREQRRGGPRYAEDIHDIDRAFDDSRITRDAELWRSVGSGRSIFGHPSTWGDDLAGFEWSESAYSSTSAAKTVADRFTKDGGVRLRVLAPKGSKAIQLSAMPEGGTAGYADEAEVLLARGARYRVVKDRGWTEITHPTGHHRIRVRDLDVEVVVPDVTPPLPWETK